MPASPAPAAAAAAATALEALGFALFLRDGGEDAPLRCAGLPPKWLTELWPGLGAGADGALLPVAEASPFLENFLVDAAECWQASGDARATSGPWVERDPLGREVELEATALTLPREGQVEGRPALVLARLGADFAARKSVLQKAREVVLLNQRLQAELQKKDILLHCIAEDLSAALGNVITSLRLLELEQEPAQIRRLLDLAALATQEQQSLIGRVLDAFADEMRALYGSHGAARATADARAATGRAVTALAARFAEKRVRLALSPPDDAALPALRVAADAGQLERVLSNLLEAALDATPPGGQVHLRLCEETESGRWEIEDHGRALPAEMRERLFARFTSAAAATGGGAATGLLRLQFCRIAVENCMGEMAYESRDERDPSAGQERGNILWIRLPRAAVPALDQSAVAAPADATR